MNSERAKLLCEYVHDVGPYLSQIVLIGGWVPYVYARRYGLDKVNPPMQTADFDAAIMRDFEDKLPSIDETLRGIGYEWNFKGADPSPPVGYRKEIPGDPRIREIEFVTQSDHSEKQMIKIGSLEIEPLPYIDIMTDHCVEYAMTDLGLCGPEVLRIPEPGAFVLHKILVAPCRLQQEKRAKDLYYAFYSLDSFPEWEDHTLATINEIASTNTRYRKQTRLLLSEYFEDTDSIGIDAVIAQRPPAAYADMNDDQFRHYVLHVMRKIEQEIPF